MFDGADSRDHACSGREGENLRVIILDNHSYHVHQRGTVKVEAARKRPNVKVVWLAWFTDSIALWRRQEETPYLLDDPPTAGPSSSPTISHNQISSDPDIDEDEDWELEASAGAGTGASGSAPAPGLGSGGSFSADQINWDDINDEVEAAMMESDDEDDDAIDVKSGLQSENVSDEEWSDESNSVIRCVAFVLEWMCEVR